MPRQPVVEGKVWTSVAGLADEGFGSTWYTWGVVSKVARIWPLALTARFSTHVSRVKLWMEVTVGLRVAARMA